MNNSGQSHSKPQQVCATGLTVLVAPIEPSLDIVFVHGFTGHPERTWTHKAGDVTTHNDGGQGYSKSSRRRLFSSSSHSAVYWPRDLLPDIVPSARVMVHGYDTRVRHILGKPASQNTVYDIAGDFLVALEANRRVQPDRPILFIVHSLGGIVVKEMLRRSSGCDIDRTHLQTIFDSTIGVMFFGTPHGGADPRGLSQLISEKAIRAAGFQVNDQIVNTLLPSSERLKELRDEFGPIARQQGWIIHSFQEELGVKVLNGRKVVEDASSYLNIPAIEITEHIGRNHMDMCRFTGPDDSQYMQVAAALQRMTGQLSPQSKNGTFSPATEELREKHREKLNIKQREKSKNKQREKLREELLESLTFSQIDFRRITIKKAHAKSCLWLLECPLYLNWNDPNKLSEHHGFLWLKGKPGAGKSTLLKFALDNAQAEANNDIVISFFFNARGVTLEKSTTGMYRSLLLQLLSGLPRLRYVFDSLQLVGSNNRDYQWSIEPLKDLFVQAVLKLESTSVSCFVDALDECEEGQIRDMVYFFEHLGELVVSNKLHFRVCFSSRHYPRITINKGYSLELERENGHKQDIIRYLDNKLEIGQSELAKTIRDKIQVKASGVFMWVVLVVEILNRDFDDGRLHALLARLNEIPRGLHELFHQLLTRDNRNRDELLLCIRWVLFARRQLSSEELYFAIISGSAPETLASLDLKDVTSSIVDRFILSSSKGLVEITRPKFGNHTVQFIHESVRDYFLKEGGVSKIWPHLRADIEGESHEVLKQCCLNYFRCGIAYNIDLSVCPTREVRRYLEAQDRKMNRGVSFLKYSIQNILHHAEAAHVGGIDQLNFIQNFQIEDWVTIGRKLALYPFRDFKCPSLLYILAMYDMPALIRCQPSGRSSFRQEDEYYGIPIFAAIEGGSTGATKELLRIQTENQPSDSSLHELYKKIFEAKDFTRGRVHSSRYLKYRRTGIPRLSCEEIFQFYSSSKDCDANLGLHFNGRTRLIAAVQHGYLYMVELLLMKGSDVEQRDAHGRNPLSWAVEQGHTRVTKILLEYGAKFDTEWLRYDQYQQSTLSNTAAKGYASVIQLPPDRHASTEPGDYRGWRLIHGAIYHDMLDVIQILLDRGASIESRDIFGQTPLILAAYYGQWMTVKLLIQRGANSNAKDNDRKMAYQYAALRNHKDVMTFLKEAGVNTKSKDKDGQKPPSAGDLQCVAEWMRK